MEKNKEIKKAMVLSSGGVDSTTCLGMAVEKYGKDKIVKAMLVQKAQDYVIEHANISYK